MLQSLAKSKPRLGEKRKGKGRGWNEGNYEMLVGSPQSLLSKSDVNMAGLPLSAIEIICFLLLLLLLLLSLLFCFVFGIVSLCHPGWNTVVQ